MKKLMLLIAACCFVFVSCNNKPVEEAEAVEATDSVAVEDEACCQMTEEQKAFKADWENWANQTDERKAELLAKRKECFDNHIAEMEAHKKDMEAKKAECEAKHAEMTKAYAGWDKMTLDEQKAFMDQYAPCCQEHKCGGHEGCCKEGKKHECNGKCEGKCNHEGNHEGCCKNK